VVKEMIFWRGKALYLYGTGRAIQESQRKLREHLGFLKDDSDDFRETPGNQRNLQEQFLKAN
jgi:hypothetical protein